MNGGRATGWMGWGMLLGMLFLGPSVFAGDFTFVTNTDNTITLTDYTGADREVVVPSHVNELPVVEIGLNAFSGCRTVSGIELPAGLLRIERGAFTACTNLSGIFIPAAVNSIGESAFNWCSRMTTIDVDPNNPYFESRNGVLFNEVGSVLIRCPGGMTGTYVVPGGVVELAPDAFFDCNEMTAVEIPDGVLRIGELAFYSCDVMTNVLLPQSVTNVVDRAFAGCAILASFSVDSNNPAYEAVDGALLSKGGGEYVQCPGGRTGTYAVPATVTNIHGGAFAGCEGLTNVWISGSVIAMEPDPFEWCSNLESIEVDPLNPAFVSMDGVLYSRDLHVLVRYPPGKPGPFVLLDSATDIADYACSYCAGFTQATLGNAVTNIGIMAFQYCTNMNTAVVGNGVAHIGALAFVSCFNLRGIYFAGNAPSLERTIVIGFTMFYHLAEATGWNSSPWNYYFRFRMALWVPRISQEGLGMQAGRFGFRMNWAAGHAVVVEACTNVAAPVWLPLATNGMVDGTGIFEDEEETNAGVRFYRVMPAP